MTTRTARLYESDVHRAQVIAAVRGESAQDVLHLALEEFIANHRVELQGVFRAVQDAVLSDNREDLRVILASSVPRLARSDAARVARLVEENRGR